MQKADIKIIEAEILSRAQITRPGCEFTITLQQFSILLNRAISITDAYNLAHKACDNAQQTNPRIRWGHFDQNGTQSCWSFSIATNEQLRNRLRTLKEAVAKRS